MRSLAVLTVISRAHPTEEIRRLEALVLQDSRMPFCFQQPGCVSRRGPAETGRFSPRRLGSAQLASDL